MLPDSRVALPIAVVYPSKVSSSTPKVAAVDAALFNDCDKS